MLIEVFFASIGMEDAIQNAISVSSDSDTLAAISGGLPEAYNGISTCIRDSAINFLYHSLLDILVVFGESIHLIFCVL